MSCSGGKSKATLTTIDLDKRTFNQQMRTVKLSVVIELKKHKNQETVFRNGTL